MSTQQKSSELLTFGYVKNAYNAAIPAQLVKLMQLFYDDWIYWMFKDKKLQQFMNKKINEYTISSKKFNIKSIEFEVYSYPNGYTDDTYDFKDLVLFVWETKYVPENIQSFLFYLEIKCEALNCSTKRLNEAQSANNYKFSNQALICQLSELKNLNSICFNIMVNMKCIKYKKDCNKINYYTPINKMKKHSNFTWNINDSLLKRCKKMYYGQDIYSQTFDNNNWCLVLFPNGGTSGSEGSSEMFLQCIHFPHNIQSMDVKLQFDFNGRSMTRTNNFRPNSNKIGRTIMSLSEFKQMESFSFSVTLEIINIYDENDQIIEQTHWERLGITVSDSNKE